MSQFSRVEILAAKAASEVPLAELAALTDAEYEDFVVRTLLLLRKRRAESLRREPCPNP